MKVPVLLRIGFHEGIWQGVVCPRDMANSSLPGGPAFVPVTVVPVCSGIVFTYSGIDAMQASNPEHLVLSELI